MKRKTLISIASTALSLMTIASMAYASALAANDRIETQNTIRQTIYDYSQIQCLAQNIYHEARSESVTGKRAVAWVTLNRVDSVEFPDTVCDVVFQSKKDKKGNPLRHKCQFSWYCDGKDDEISDIDSWNESLHVAEIVYENHSNGLPFDPTEGAIMYHASYVNPYWTDSFDKTVRIDDHVFYK